VQTFVPLSSFKESAKVLDLRRLGKQIIEAQQIFKALSYPEYGWKSHPATKMWRGHRIALYEYAKSIHEEWVLRRSNTHQAFVNLDNIRSSLSVRGESSLPEWWGDDRVHVSHQSNLIRKDPDHYQKYFQGVRSDLEYFWPVP